MIRTIQRKIKYFEKKPRFVFLLNGNGVYQNKMPGSDAKFLEDLALDEVSAYTKMIHLLIFRNVQRFFYDVQYVSVLIKISTKVSQNFITVIILPYLLKCFN